MKIRTKRLARHLGKVRKALTCEGDYLLPPYQQRKIEEKASEEILESPFEVPDYLEYGL